MESPSISDRDRAKLLMLARSAILRSLGNEAAEPDVPRDLMEKKRGVFVTLRQEGELRGCIGYVDPIDSIAGAVKELAVKAASEDPRFSAVHLSEMGSLSIEISVLSPLKPCANMKEIEVGRHGIIIEKDGRRGLLLPEVAVEAGWDAITFVRHCCVKAGLPMEASEDPRTKIWIFTSEHFEDEDAPNRTGGG